MPIGAYNATIPQATDIPAQSQPQLLANFDAINLIVDINHYTFNAGANAGKHKFLQLPVQVAAPAIAATELGLYTLLNADTTLNEMYIRRSSGSQIPFTAFSIDAPASIFATGYTWLPSGMLLKFGTVTTTAVPVGGFPFTFEIDVSAAPAFVNRPLAVTLTPLVPSAGSSNIAFILSSINAAPTVKLIVRAEIRDTAQTTPVNYSLSWTALGQGI